MNYEITAFSSFGICRADSSKTTFTAAEDTNQCFFEMNVTFDHWEDEFYLLMPACAYNGNRYEKVKRSYPPMYKPEETDRQLITDVPALAPDGSGIIEVTAGDMSVPCVCVLNPKEKQAFMLFTKQEIKGENLGFRVEKGRITVSYPAIRTTAYRFCREHETNCDSGIAVKKGETFTLEHKIVSFPCENIDALFTCFFKNRKCLLSGPRPENLYTDALWDMQEDKFNSYNYSGEYYAEITKIWQCGWCGGAISSLPLFMCGNALSKERAINTLDYLFAHQANSGFFYGYIKNGVTEDDSFHTPGMEHLHMIRKSADVLYHLFRHFRVMNPKPHWITGTKKCADAFVTLFQQFGTFGQFINIETGELVVKSSTAGAMAIGGLALAWEFFGEPVYLETAKRACDFYYHRDIENGVTTGGPGEILGAPDSESAFAMLESCVTLFEVTKEEKWLRYAESCAHLAASWVVTYPYLFPKNSEFYRLGINTVGSVFANVQNKHSAPGICTLSGDSLYKLWRYTGNHEYLELIKDIAFFIPQCVSTKKRPIYSWDDTPKLLPEGFICERVNMSDWEGKQNIGGVFCCSCWCETSLLLTFTELMCYDEMKR